LKKDSLSNIANYKFIALGAVTNKDNWRGLIVSFLIIIVLSILVVVLVGKMIDKFIGIKRIQLSETPGKRIDRWGRTIILFIFLVLNVTSESDALKIWSFLLFLTTLLVFEVILEWKYVKEPKQYIATLINSTITIIFLIGVYFYVKGNISFLFY